MTLRGLSHLGFSILQARGSTDSTTKSREAKTDRGDPVPRDRCAWPCGAHESGLGPGSLLTASFLETCSRHGPDDDHLASGRGDSTGGRNTHTRAVLETRSAKPTRCPGCGARGDCGP